jgi:hypothetical protein
MKKFLRIIAMLAIVVPVLFYSCSLLEDETPSKGTGKIAIHITDAPFPADLVEQVLVTVDSIGLRYEGGECKTPEGADAAEFECEEGFLILLNEPVEIDLLQLRNGLTELLVDAEIPVGKYDMVKIFVKEATIIVEPGTSFALKIPGGSTGGLKIFLNEPVTVTEEGLAEVLLDFDLSRSFVALGNPKNKKGIHGFIFKPVIRAVDVNVSGSIKGKVVDASNKAIDNALVTLYKGEEEVTTSLTEEDGVFKIIGVPAGTYRMTVAKEGFVTAELTGIVVNKKKEVVKTIKLISE